MLLSLSIYDNIFSYLVLELIRRNISDLESFDLDVRWNSSKPKYCLLNR